MAERKPALRPFWAGTVTFGLVSIQVELFSAVRSSRPSLRMLGPDGHPLKRRYVRPEGHRPLESEQIVRGFEVQPGRFVTVTDEELEALEPSKTREIDLRRFVDRDAIDPMYCDRPYFLLPQGQITKPYRLLAKTMEETGKAGVASFVLRGREQLIAIFADRGILHAETLRRPDALRTAEQVGLPDPAKAPPEQVQRMRAGIEGLMADDLDPAELADLDARALAELARKKAGTERVRVTEVEEEASEGVVDIMEVLRQRLGVAPEPAEAPPSGVREVRPAAREVRATQGQAAPTDGEAEDLASLTKAELYARAQARAIPGRSKMSREELLAALRGR